MKKLISYEIMTSIIALVVFFVIYRNFGLDGIAAFIVMATLTAFVIAVISDDDGVDNEAVPAVVTTLIAIVTVVVTPIIATVTSFSINDVVAVVIISLIITFATFIAIEYAIEYAKERGIKKRYIIYSVTAEFAVIAIPISLTLY